MLGRHITITCLKMDLGDIFLYYSDYALSILIIGVNDPIVRSPFLKKWAMV